MAKKEKQLPVKREMLTSKPRKKVLISNDFREILISQETSIIEQRIITMILSAIKDEQSMFITVKSPIADPNNKQLSFDDYFEGWAHQGVTDFSVSINDLNPGRKMKNSVIQKALVNMTNINWLRLKDDTINGYKAVPFILEPSWNKKNIYFKMDKAVMQHLLNMSQYYSIKKDELATIFETKFIYGAAGQARLRRRQQHRDRRLVLLDGGSRSRLRSLPDGDRLRA